MGFGILPVTAGFLEQLFSLPEGYTIVGAIYDPAFKRLNFSLASDALPSTDEECVMSNLELFVTVDWLPEHPEYRRFTTEIKVSELQEKQP